MNQRPRQIWAGAVAWAAACCAAAGGCALPAAGQVGGGGVAAAPPDRVALRQVDQATATLHWVVDERLDLAARLARLEGDAAASLVPLAPRMVAGQGPHPTNRSVVRVLNRYGIAEAQFLAFDASDRGGVRVAAGRDAAGDPVIAATLFEPRGRPTVRVFSDAGGLRHEIPSPLGGDPLLIQLGDFLPDRAGDELAVVPATTGGRGTPLVLLDLQGQTLQETTLDLPPRQQLTLSRSRHAAGAVRLVVHARPDHVLLTYDPADQKTQTQPLAGLDPGDRVYPAHLGGGQGVAAADGGVQSFLKPIQNRAAQPPVDVGFHENQFWISPGSWSPQQRGGPYVRVVQDYAHLRMDLGNPALTPPEAWDRPDVWPRIEAATVKQWANNLRPLGQQPLRMWEPTVTHRMNWDKANPWAQRNDPATGRPRFLALDRDDQPQSYGEFGKANQFHTFTYAYGDTALDQLYCVPLMQFLRRLAVSFRTAPQRMISLEPNHEHEISVGAAGSVGDYHPRMIAGFRDYLERLYGPGRALADRFGVPAEADRFDAPRDRGRGPWDRYDLGNPLYREWIAYQRLTVNRRIADSFVAALAAGFPPEIVKSHQIPDTYAVGSTQTFSDRKARITPVDYALSAGVGFGFTRYGIWFKKPSNMLQAAHSSGFRSIVMGEYQGLTPQAGPAVQQLRHLFENGVTAVHAMDWPASHDKGFNASMRQAIATLLNEQKPRPGLAGGVGGMIPVTTNTRRFDVAVIGSGAEHTGLLKSLDDQGQWEGSVYAVPFRSGIDLEPVRGRTSRGPDGGLEARYPLETFDGGQQFHLTLAGRGGQGGSGDGGQNLQLKLDVQRGGVSLPGFAATLPVDADRPRRYRVVLRNQLPADGLEVVLQLPAGFELTESAEATLLSDDLARLHRDDDRGTAHRGSVTFDLWP